MGEKRENKVTGDEEKTVVVTFDEKEYAILEKMMGVSKIKDKSMYLLSCFAYRVRDVLIDPEIEIKRKEKTE